jgi:hypothetical protein
MLRFNILIKSIGSIFLQFFSKKMLVSIFIQHLLVEMLNGPSSVGLWWLWNGMELRLT